ncbi:MAG TPA: hypothetical protein PK170_00055 [Anaerolineae bacterium]|nr:hypothetical protein [Anaerolineae bacterium]
MSTDSSQAEGVQSIQDLARPPGVVAAESHPLQSSAEPLASRLPMDGEPLERDQWVAMKPPVNVQPLSSQLAQPLEVPSSRAATSLNGQPPDLEGPSQPVAMAHQFGSFATRSQSAEEPDSAPALPQTLAPSLTHALEQAVGAVSPRLHMSWDGQGVQVWLGLDGQPNVEALLHAVQRVLRQHGLQLSTLVCNGRVLVASRAAPQHPADAPLTQQDN